MGSAVARMPGLQKALKMGRARSALLNVKFA
jgi:hypothetical protein